MLGNRQDTTSNDLFAFILHQVGLVNVPYNPVLHDLSLTPRPMSAWQTVDYWLEMFDSLEVTEWSQYLDAIDLPRLQMSFTLNWKIGKPTAILFKRPFLGGSYPF